MKLRSEGREEGKREGGKFILSPDAPRPSDSVSYLVSTLGKLLNALTSARTTALFSGGRLIVPLVQERMIIAVS